MILAREIKYTVDKGFSGCFVNLVFAIDASGDLSQTSELIRKTIDQLSTMFSQNTYLSILSVAPDGSGKSASLQKPANILTDSSKLKDSTRISPSSFPSELFSLIKDSFDNKQSQKQKVVFFFGTQLLQYATTVVQQLKKAYPSVEVIAVTTQKSGGPTAKDMEALTGSALNVLTAPQAADLADSLKC